MPAALDVTGETYNRLTAIKDTGNRTEGGQAIWLWLCECGGEIEVRLDSVRYDRTKSCGCLNRERLREHGRRLGKSQIGENHGRWSGNEASYDAAHKRHRKARDITTIDCLCGEQAHENAYMGDCPNEKLDDSGRPYCLHLGCYLALCRSCHQIYDQGGMSGTQG